MQPVIGVESPRPGKVLHDNDVYDLAVLFRQAVAIVRPRG